MDTSRVSLGEMIAGAGGLALLVLMFLPWFGGHVSGELGRARLPTDTGWESLGGLLDALIIAAVALAIGTAVASAAGSRPRLPVEQGLVVLAAGAGAFVVLAITLVSPPGIDLPIPNIDVDRSRKAAAFLALAAAAAIAYGGNLQRRDALARRRLSPGGG